GISVLQQFIDEEIMKNLANQLNSAIEGLESPTKDRIREFILSTKGKQLRPALIAVTTKLLIQDTESQESRLARAYRFAIVIELLHNMTLIHDDLIDGAPVRRGKEAFHIRYGADRALHDGDILHAYALTLIKDDPEGLKLVCDYAYQVGLGNAIELEDRLDQNFDFEMDRIIKIMEYKTAVVFAGCVRLGCLAANREDLFTEELNTAICAAGIAFQIQDDYLDILGNPEEFGKMQFWDIQESKRNLFLYFSMQTPDSAKIKEIYNKEIGEKTPKDIEIILEAFRTIQEKVKEVRDKYAKLAIDGLKSIQVNIEDDDYQAEELIDFLLVLTKYLIERKK
ncbi:MAG: polyprenyl synthetase family protein, partial [Candidatus Hodarchaeales archaeon]